jgi:curli biogenesis system outer membrane secretion channel CsgG
MKRTALLICLPVVASCLLLVGCSSSETTYARDSNTDLIGRYDAPPAGIARDIRVGVPNFLVSGEAATEGMTALAADQLTSLVLNLDRFEVYERAQMPQMIKEQSLEGFVRSDELAKAAQARGIHHLIYGKITNFRVKAEKTSKGFGLAHVNIPGGGNLGAFDYKNKNSKITVDCGVDLRMVDPTTGKIDAAHFGEFSRTDSLGAIGIEILGASAEADAKLDISDDDKGKLLRFALDDALRKMIPRIDRYLVEKGREQKAAAAAAAAAAAPAAAPAATEPAAAKKFCSGCGGKLEADAKFCPGCGNKV